MPTYDYECTECGTVFELVQPITEKPRRRLKKADPQPCDCSATVTRRIGTGGGIIFKGSGFYETDYRSENYKKGAEAEKKKTDEKPKKTESKEKTSASKTETKSTKSTGSKPKSTD